jgi:predicted aldo/keto reductase-like oxidoreductase
VGLHHNTQIDAPAALKWALQDPNVHTIIAGFTTFDQLETDLKVLRDLSLSKSEKENLRRAALQTGLYCQGCGKCLGQCVKQLPIPDLMRAYMYLYGYRNLVEAQDLISSLNLPAGLCGTADVPGQVPEPMECFRADSKRRPSAKVPPELIAA